jgi:hypothetical protein
MSLAKPKRKKIGPFQLSLSQINGNGEPTEFQLDKLPFNNEFGIGYVTDIEAYLGPMAVTSEAGNDAIPWYLAHRLLGWQVVGPTGTTIFDRQTGFDDPIREYQLNGALRGQIPADLAATTDAAVTTSITFSKFCTHAMRRMVNPLWRCYPAAYYRAGKIIVYARTTDQTVTETQVFKLHDLTLTFYFWILDVPTSEAFIPSITVERFNPALIDPSHSSPGAAHFAELLYMMDPAAPTFGDDLSTYNIIQFGTDGDGAGTIIKRVETFEYMQTWNDDFVVGAQPKKNSLGALTGTQEVNRFFDAANNASGRLHALPLVTPHRGDDLIHLPMWTSKPQLVVNDDNPSGLPQPRAIWTEILSRTDADIKSICDAVDVRAYARFDSQAAGAKRAGYGGYPDPSKAPLKVPGLFG